MHAVHVEAPGRAKVPALQSVPTPFSQVLPPGRRSHVFLVMLTLKPILGQARAPKLSAIWELVALVQALWPMDEYVLNGQGARLSLVQ